jgi:hypothetical protein
MLTVIGRWIPLALLKRIFKMSTYDYDAKLVFVSRFYDDETGDTKVSDENTVMVKVQQIDNGCWICYSAVREREIEKRRLQERIEHLDDDIEFLKNKESRGK